MENGGIWLDAQHQSPSLSERCGELPCMPWQLGSPRLQLQFVLVAVLLLLREQRGRPEQRRGVWQSRKAEMVASRFVRDVHAC